ncbi:mRNA interferase MazF [Rhodopseudomonas rhenobacensis]|uniref:mRNA interferase MazF n=1 Tax=Rhodopseudomonas rhenobacensis TaxID=87461 RepID=A0A7W7Z8D9_9BRAD|nr:mRNA interferase MazF [Rhodopseudomonas rhenobacensis]
MTRGDIVLVVLQGDFGKPRPAVIVQANAFTDIASLAVLPLTTELRDVPALRIQIEPDPSNGLVQRSQVMVDKITAVALRRVSRRIGRLSDTDMTLVNRALAIFLGFV